MTNPLPAKTLFGVLCLVFCSLTLRAQTPGITLSGSVKDKVGKTALAYVNVSLKKAEDSTFFAGTITDEKGLFSISGIKPGNYLLQLEYAGYERFQQALFAGSLSEYLALPVIELNPVSTTSKTIDINVNRENLSNKMDKKTYQVSDNVSQAGGSVLQAMQNLPGITLQDGKVQLRGSDKVIILIDGKQTAMTGFGSQNALDNIPASSIERIEIINNPSSKFEANGNAGIINIIMKKTDKQGFNGQIGFAVGAGALWVKQANLPGIRPQYQGTPKINPSISLNYRKRKMNVFFQADNLYTHTLNKNEFVTRTYDSGTLIKQQLKRNRNTNFFTSRAGLDLYLNDNNQLTISGLFGSEKILDHGDEPFFNGNLSERLRLWQFLEDELKTTLMTGAVFLHKFKEAGHQLNMGFNYTYHRENEKYYFDNILKTYSGKDAFKLLSDEHVSDFNLDYLRPVKYGKFESGVKLRYRNIPTNMQFFPGFNSPLDSNAGGWAIYREIIPAVYGNYILEKKKFELETGLRLEYVSVNYKVNPNHNTYKSNGYNYSQPFPNLRLAYKINDRNKLSFFFNRRVDRPNEVDIRIFPKYDDAEIIKVGNPALKPQFTNSMELGYKKSLANGYFYSAFYHRSTYGTITRISGIVPGSTLIYAVFQNAGHSYNTGLEISFSYKIRKWYSFNLNSNIYRNQINAFTVENLYPVPHTFSTTKQEFISGNLKLNNTFNLKKQWDLQIVMVYLAPDIIPQGKIKQRFSLDMGLKKTLPHKKGELFFNATDLFNTLVIRKQINGNGFSYTSADYYETQVLRIGYSYKF